MMDREPWQTQSSGPCGVTQKINIYIVVVVAYNVMHAQKRKVVCIGAKPEKFRARTNMRCMYAKSPKYIEREPSLSHCANIYISAGQSAVGLSDCHALIYPGFGHRFSGWLPGQTLESSFQHRYLPGSYGR